MTAVLGMAALGSVGAFEVTEQVVPPRGLERDMLDDRIELARDEAGAVFYIVDSQAEAVALEVAVAHEWSALEERSQAKLSISVFAADAPENEALMETLTATDWMAELGLHVTLVDLREGDSASCATRGQDCEDP